MALPGKTFLPGLIVLEQERVNANIARVRATVGLSAAMRSAGPKAAWRQARDELPARANGTDRGHG